MKKQIFKTKKQKNRFLFVFIACLTIICLVIGIAFLVSSSKEYTDQVSRTKDYLNINSIKSALQENNWNPDGVNLGKWQTELSSYPSNNQQELQPWFENKIQEIITDQKLIKEVDVPLFAYGIFLTVMGVITGIGTWLFGNSIFNKKYQNQQNN
ncbi:hypothetical protein [Mycoplasma sp. E35C]|uniref:hypothetical protein n=1 Tax=Mycoplasma sp. E35C TaxID=2801918 RepID=UPI001CA39BD9|nr:hypothetical protein [Mycoplasma sp. E35C]QZX49105.1 hypothetical protein JJE79_03575 [Mycoplasma sp. E35C]